MEKWYPSHSVCGLLVEWALQRSQKKTVHGPTHVRWPKASWLLKARVLESLFKGWMLPVTELHTHKGLSRSAVGRAVWGKMVNVMNKNIRNDMPQKTGELLVCKSCLSFNSKTESPKRRCIGRKDLYWKCQSWCLLHSYSLSSETAAPEEDLGSILPARPWDKGEVLALRAAMFHSQWVIMWSSWLNESTSQKLE